MVWAFDVWQLAQLSAADRADLARLLRSPVFSADEQTRALSGVLDRTGIDGLAANVLKLLGTNRRLFAALDVGRAYRALGHRVLDLQRVRIDGLELGDLDEGTVRPLRTDEVARLKSATGLT